MGVPQGSELPYLFRTLASMGGASHTPMEAEVGLSRRVMQYFAVYPWSGIPFKREQLPLYDPIKQNFFRIGLESSEVEKMPLTQHCSILASLLVKKLSPTAQPNVSPFQQRGLELREGFPAGEQSQDVPSPGGCE
ncbi:unnamed protein product [Natator depressus]